MARSFLKRLEKEYRSAKIVLSADELNEQRGRELALCVHIFLYIFKLIN